MISFLNTPTYVIGISNYSTDEGNEGQRENWFPKVWNRAVNLFPVLLPLISSASVRNAGRCGETLPRERPNPAKQQTSSEPKIHNPRWEAVASALSSKGHFCFLNHNVLWSHPQCQAEPRSQGWRDFILSHMHVLYLVMESGPSHPRKAIWKYFGNWKCLQPTWRCHLLESMCQSVYNNSFDSFNSKHFLHGTLKNNLHLFWLESHEKVISQLY